MWERERHTGESEDTGVRDRDRSERKGERKIKRDSRWERER